MTLWQNEHVHCIRDNMSVPAADVDRYSKLQALNTCTDSPAAGPHLELYDVSLCQFVLCLTFGFSLQVFTVRPLSAAHER